jgi:hypothetical protein
MDRAQILAKLRSSILAARRCEEEAELLAAAQSAAQDLLTAGGVEVLGNGPALLRALAELRPRRMEDATFIALLGHFLGRCVERAGDEAPAPSPALPVEEPARKGFQMLLDEPALPGATGDVTTRRDTLRETLGGPLPIAGRPDPARIAALDDHFPWFAPVTGAILRRVRLVDRLNAARLDLPPLLLVGPPGIGKTRYALALAEALGRRGFLQPMAGLSSAFAITGVEPSFQAAQPSLPVRAAMETGRADPLIILDEIEKVGTDRHFGAPLEALLPLLEPSTAARFRDAFLDRLLDASLFSWCATANAARGLPTPLLSRFEVMPAPEPQADQIDSILLNFRLDWAKRLGLALASLPPESEVTRAMLQRDLRRSPDLRRLERAWRAAVELQCLAGEKATDG